MWNYRCFFLSLSIKNTAPVAVAAPAAAAAAGAAVPINVVAATLCNIANKDPAATFPIVAWIPEKSNIIYNHWFHLNITNQGNQKQILLRYKPKVLVCENESDLRRLIQLRLHLH